MTNPTKFNRRSTRLRGYDYTQSGACFVTICANENDIPIVCRGDACVALNLSSNTDPNTGPKPTDVFGHIDNGRMIQNHAGRIIEQSWLAIPDHFLSVVLDEFVVMPNHVHGILIIDDNDNIRATHASPLQIKSNSNTGPKPGSVGAVVGAFKSATTKQINQARSTPGAKVWQRNYHDRIIRNDDELNRIREYIINNPANWDSDDNNPNHKERP
jgi:putative transposase